MPELDGARTLEFSARHFGLAELEALGQPALHVMHVTGDGIANRFQAHIEMSRHAETATDFLRDQRDPESHGALASAPTPVCSEDPFVMVGRLT